MNVGSMVRVRRDAFPDDDMKHVMYAGWYGIIKKRDGIMAFVDSDDFTRQTGYMQAVSFRAWFSVAELEEAHITPKETTPNE